MPTPRRRPADDNRSAQETIDSSDLLALEAIGHGIRVNAVGSGDVITNILNEMHDDGPGVLAEHGKNAPIGRAAQPRRSPK